MRGLVFQDPTKAIQLCPLRPRLSVLLGVRAGSWGTKSTLSKQHEKPPTLH